MTPTEREWKALLEVVYDVMIRFENDPKFSLEEVYKSLSQFYNSDLIEDEVVSYFENVISEIGGSPNSFSEVKLLAKNKVTYSEFKKYMES